MLRPLQSADHPERKQEGDSTHHRTSFIEMDPPSTHIYNPNSYPCFHNHTALADHCAAWDCLEQIAQCGEKGYILDLQDLICYNIDSYFNLFTPGGKAFLRCFQNVTVAENVALFRDNIKPCCGKLEDYGGSMERGQSWVNCGFCGIYNENYSAFGRLFANNFDPVDTGLIFKTLCSQFKKKP